MRNPCEREHAFSSPGCVDCGALPPVYARAEKAEASLADALCRLERMSMRCGAAEGALREIAIGKIASDNESPYGEGCSMAGRFMSIAQETLRDRKRTTSARSTDETG